MSAAQIRPVELSLVSVFGPTPVSLPLSPEGSVTLGRTAHHTLELPHPRVSRDHAVLSYHAHRWLISDSGSLHGTWLNGVRLEPARPLPIRAGDLLVIGPWTLRVQGNQPSTELGTSIASLNDVVAGTVTCVDARAADSLAQERLALLLQCATAIHTAATEKDLAEAVLDAAVSGTGFANAAILRWLTQADQIEVLARRGAILDCSEAPQLSRSLVRKAAEGVPARLVIGEAEPTRSLVELNIGEALCIPLLLEGAPCGFIYLDNRGQKPRHRCVSADAAPYAIGLARLAGLALANLQRLDVERRHAYMQAELSAAGVMQSMLLPPREGKFGAFSYVGESRPGRFIGGDFFDVIPLADGRLAVAVGDVAGKGVEASVLITASQGFLHAALQQHGDVGRALSDLSAYVQPRCPMNKFITLWAGVFDAAAGTLDYVDAGHGHAFFILPDGNVVAISPKRYPPLGTMEQAEYQAERAALPPGGRALIISDGLLEEPSRTQERSADGRIDRFSMDRLKQCLAHLAPEQDEVAALFKAVQDYAGRETLQDDATAVVIRWQ